MWSNNPYKILLKNGISLTISVPTPICRGLFKPNNHKFAILGHLKKLFFKYFAQKGILNFYLYIERRSIMLKCATKWFLLHSILLGEYVCALYGVRLMLVRTENCSFPYEMSTANVRQLELYLVEWVRNVTPGLRNRPTNQINLQE